MWWSTGCGFAGWGSSLRVVSCIIAKLCQGCQNRFGHIKQARVIFMPGQKISDGPSVVYFLLLLLEVNRPTEQLEMGFPKCHSQIPVGGVSCSDTHIAWGFSCGKPLSQLPALEERPGQKVFLCSPEVSLLELLEALRTSRKFSEVTNGIELQLKSSSGLKEVIVACK